MAVVIDKKIKVPLHYQIYLDLLKKIQNWCLESGRKTSYRSGTGRDVWSKQDNSSWSY